MAEFPLYGEKPYGAKVKAYIDEAEADAVAAAALGTANYAAPKAHTHEDPPSSIVDAKGDLLVGTAADTVSRLAVGGNGAVLVADSSQATGVTWGTRPILETNLATSPIPTSTDITGDGAGYSSAFFGGDSTPSLVAAGGDGPVVDGVALAYRRKTITTASVDGNRLTWILTHLNPDAPTKPGGYGAFPVAADHTYRVTFHWRITNAAAPTAGTGMIAFAYTPDGSAQVYVPVTGGTMEPSGAWARFTGTFTVPAGYPWVGLRTEPTSATATTGDTSDITGLIITDVTDDTSTDAAYFDGSAPGCAWIGATNSSASVRNLVGAATYQSTTSALARNLVGTGSPEGVMTAPVGSRYVDTAATNGAVEWIKAAGSGKTGWRVAYGDTGWRRLDALLLNGWTGRASIICRNDAVELMLSVNGSAATDPRILDIPAGFSVGYVIDTEFPLSAMPGEFAFILPWEQRILGVVGGLGLVRAHGVWTTTGWPAALPGVAL